MTRQLKKQTATLEGALRTAESYTEWAAIAAEIDKLLGFEIWRKDDYSPHYHHKRLRRHLGTMKKLREDRQPQALEAFLWQSLQRNLTDLRSRQLYEGALSGPKLLVHEFLEEVESSLIYLASTEDIDTPAGERLAKFEHAFRIFGRSALMLSGGAALGFYHLGVVKTLHEHNALPDVLSGSSAGAMIAAGVCARTDEELTALFEDPSAIELEGIRPAGLQRIRFQKAVMDPDILLRTLRKNIGDFTFSEAFAHSGRTLNICVSPTRIQQKPRMLNHLSTPDVMVPTAVLASSALPVFFPPVTLTHRNRGGDEVPYMPEETWIDGSMRGDLPTERLGRLHNVNHFIASQANPHVLPFARLQDRAGVLPLTGRLMTSSLYMQTLLALNVGREISGNTPLRAWLEHTHALLAQPYRGDINITPNFSLRAFRKLMSNPSPKELLDFIAAGERATWPKLAMIIDQTRITRTFSDCIDRLKRCPPSLTPGEYFDAAH